MEEYINRDIDVNDHLKYSIASLKGIPASNISILNSTINDSDEYGKINVKYSYNNHESTISVLRAVLSTISIYIPPSGKSYNSRDGIVSNFDINGWTKDKHLKFVCDQLDIPSSDASIGNIWMNFDSGRDIDIYTDIVANNNSMYLCGKINIKTSFKVAGYVDAEDENIKGLLPKTFRHDYVDEYINLYNDYPDNIPPEKLLELENKKIQEAGRETFFIKGPEYTYNPNSIMYIHDDYNLANTIFEKHMLGTSTGRKIYEVSKMLYWGLDYKYKESVEHCLLAGLRIDGGNENTFGIFSTRKLDLKRDLVPVMPKRGYTRIHTTSKSVYESNSNKNFDYYIDSIKYIEGSKFKLRSEPLIGKMIYYSGIKKKDSYSDSEFEDLKNNIKNGIEDQLYNVYNLPRTTVKLNMSDFATYSTNLVYVDVDSASLMVKSGKVYITIEYEASDE